MARVRVPLVSVGRDLNLQKLHYQYLTTSVAVVLADTNWFCSVSNVVCVVNGCPVHDVDLNLLSLQGLSSSLDKNA